MTNTRVNEIDLLRFFAALSVVFFHYSFRGYAADAMSVMPYPLLAPFSKYGYLGVELFFIISGFVILMTAASGSLRRFFVSRVVRLYPAFWACCTITFAAIIAIGGSRFSASVSQYLINLTMLNGFVGVPSIDGVYGTLLVEMKFYALVAVILAIGRIHQAQLFLILWLIASIALEIMPISSLRSLLIVEFSAYFIAGATYFLIWSQGVSLTRVGMIILSWGLAVFQTVNRLSTFEKHYNTVMSSDVVAGIITVFFFVMLLVSLKRTGFFSRNNWVLAGSLTYPLYLLHQNIGFMIFNIAYPAINPHLLLWSTIAGALGAAYAVHVFIEKKFSLPLKNAINNSINFMQRLVNTAIQEASSIKTR
jgi:peptidoglycan/LPS O-acetylase OafA/YrhL